MRRGQSFQLRPPRARLGREKSHIEEAIRIQAGGDQRTECGIGPRDRDDGHARMPPLRAPTRSPDRRTPACPHR